jgi:hypothetical protein
MKQVLVLVTAEYDNAKEVCEKLNKQTFKNTHSVREEFDFMLETDEEFGDIEEVLIYDIEDFVEGVNSQELDVLANYFMSVVNIEE